MYIPDLEGEFEAGNFPHVQDPELLYVDDTLLIPNNANSSNKLIQNIEVVADEYDKKLNMDKHFDISLNCKPSSTFRSGQKMAAADQVTYLGGHKFEKRMP